MRRMVERKCAQHKEFRYVVTREDGRVCCAANDPAHMCAECREAARQPPRDDVPPPPSLTDAILTHRAAAGSALDVLRRKLSRKGSGLEIARDGGVNEHGIPNPPRLLPARSER